MGKTILILGGGIGGTAAANVLSKLLKNHQIILVDREEYHLFMVSITIKELLPWLLSITK